MYRIKLFGNKTINPRFVNVIEFDSSRNVLTVVTRTGKILEVNESHVQGADGVKKLWDRLEKKLLTFPQQCI